MILSQTAEFIKLCDVQTFSINFLNQSMWFRGPNIISCATACSVSVKACPNESDVLPVNIKASKITSDAKSKCYI